MSCIAFFFLLLVYYPPFFEQNADPYLHKELEELILNTKILQRDTVVLVGEVEDI
jgi:hypothetical protein